MPQPNLSLSSGSSGAIAAGASEGEPDPSCLGRESPDASAVSSGLNPRSAEAAALDPGERDVPSTIGAGVSEREPDSSGLGSESPGASGFSFELNQRSPEARARRASANISACPASIIISNWH